MSLVGKAPKPDTAAMEAQRKKIAEQDKKLSDQEAAQLERAAAKLRARMGRAGTGAGGNTLLSGIETGLRSTLG